MAQLKGTLAAAKAVYEKVFWAGTYYRVASEGRRYNELFSDTLWPQHHAELLGLPDLVPTAHIVSHLRTASKLLMQHKDADGHLFGVANLMPLDGSVYPFKGLPPRSLSMEDAAEKGFDRTEVWIGANYELAATFIEAGKRFGLANLTATGQAIAKAIDYQVCSPSSPGKGAYVFNEPNAYYAGDPSIYRGPGMSRNLAAWDLLKAAAAAFGTGTSGDGRSTVSTGRSRRGVQVRWER